MEVRDNPKGTRENIDHIPEDNSRSLGTGPEPEGDEVPRNEEMEIESYPNVKKTDNTKGLEEKSQQLPITGNANGESTKLATEKGKVEVKAVEIIGKKNTDLTAEGAGLDEGKLGETDIISSHDSISFSSSTYLSGNTSFTRASVSKADGSLDVNKLMNWTLPKLNTSALPRSKGGHKNCSFNPGDEASAVSTPILIAANQDKFRHRKKSTKIEYGSSNEKASMLNLMNKMLEK